MHTGRQVALVVALVALAVALLAGDRRQSGGAHGARAAVTMPPLTIREWPEPIIRARRLLS